MGSTSEIGAAARAGAIAGLVVLGLVGRAAMAGVALAVGVATHLSARGVLEAAVTGTLLGAAGGLLLPSVRAYLPASRLARGVTVGAVVFFASLLFEIARGFDPQAQTAITLGVALAVCCLYGIVTDALLARLVAGPAIDDTV